jgi:acetyl-CoA synthetase
MTVQATDTASTRSPVKPNLANYEEVRASFTWKSAFAELSGLPGDRGLNIAYEAVTRHASGSLRDHVALRCLNRTGDARDLTYGELDRLTNRFANMLTDLGVEPGARVFLLSGRIPELYVAALGALKHGSVVSPLFSAFGPEPIQQRLVLGDGRCS